MDVAHAWKHTVDRSTVSPHEPAEELLARARAGDRGALETLVGVHIDPHLRRASRMLARSRGCHDNDDVLQEARVRILADGMLARFDPAKGSLAQWSWGIVRFVVLTWDRNETGRAVKLEVAAAEAADRDRERACDRPVEDLIYACRLLRQRQRLAEARLGVASPRQRQALRLVDLHDHTIEEAAETMGCTAAAVNSLLGHGRTRIRGCHGTWLEDLGFESLARTG